MRRTLSIALHGAACGCAIASALAFRAGDFGATAALLLLAIFLMLASIREKIGS